LHRQVAVQLLKSGHFEIPLPADLTTIYNIKCTDPYYPSEGDYWYFYDPFRKGCEYLSQAPFANVVSLKIAPATKRKMDQTPRLDLLRGSNGNGDDFIVYVIHGFAESTTSPRDDGRVNFRQFEAYMGQRGFEREILRKDPRRPLSLHTKTVALATGGLMNIKVYHLLVETSIDSRTVTFAKFFKQAVAEADVIVYGGHSGLGGNLDIPSLEAKAGAFTFNPNKRQIFFFDACASYAYYLNSFAAEKTRARIDVVSYGLSSYFETGQVILGRFLDIIFDPKIVDAKWMDILQHMERPLRGTTYLLNVGGV